MLAALVEDLHNRGPLGSNVDQSCVGVRRTGRCKSTDTDEIQAEAAGTRWRSMQSCGDRETVCEVSRQWVRTAALTSRTGKRVMVAAMFEEGLGQQCWLCSWQTEGYAVKVVGCVSSDKKADLEWKVAQAASTAASSCSGDRQEQSQLDACEQSECAKQVGCLRLLNCEAGSREADEVSEHQSASSVGNKLRIGGGALRQWCSGGSRVWKGG